MNKEQLKILTDSLKVKPEVFEIWFPYFKKYLAANGINTPERMLAFLAQTGQESGRFYYTEEIGEATCHGYSGGCKYKGRGLIGLTHIGNYQKFKDRYGVDVVTNPSLVGGEFATTSTPEQLKNSLLASTFYWEWAKLNDLADKLDLSKSVFDEPNLSTYKCIGRKINRGMHTDCTKAANGESVRLENFEKLRIAYNANKKQFKTLTKNSSDPILIGLSVAIGVTFVALFLYDKYKR